MTESDATMDDETNDDDQQLIKLCLNKPKQWSWELTTSKSSSNILFPTIQLYDAKGTTLLAETSEAGFVKSSKVRSAPLSKSSSLRTMKLKDSFKFKVKKDSIDEIVLEPVITEPDDETRPRKDHSASPVQVFSERGCLMRNASAKEFRKPTNEKPRNKPYSRSSSNSMRSRSSVSILERIREMKRTSSSSSEDEKDSDSDEKSGKDTHKYSYKEHSRLGTLIVPKESFTNARRRPKANEEKKGELIEK